MLVYNKYRSEKKERCNEFCVLYRAQNYAEVWARCKPRTQNEKVELRRALGIVKVWGVPYEVIFEDEQVSSTIELIKEHAQWNSPFVGGRNGWL